MGYTALWCPSRVTEVDKARQKLDVVQQRSQLTILDVDSLIFLKMDVLVY